MGHNENVYSTLKMFSGKVAKGDFIALDGNDDGEWDHMGFVVQVGTPNNYNGKYYTDFKVAQHTGDYLKWVSKERNGWDKEDDGKVKYAIVRRGSKA